MISDVEDGIKHKILLVGKTYDKVAFETQLQIEDDVYLCYHFHFFTNKNPKQLEDLNLYT
jgi:hypothetical protein